MANDGRAQLAKITLIHAGNLHLPENGSAKESVRGARHYLSRGRTLLSLGRSQFAREPNDGSSGSRLRRPSDPRQLKHVAKFSRCFYVASAQGEPHSIKLPGI